ncbi:MAG: TolC family protein [Gemmatimonadaceae bacterium]|nr:TolC family protein [Gemmatimonadaceae bacterium]
MRLSATALGFALALATVTGGLRPTQAVAQAAPAAGNVLTLADAITLARRNNPGLQTSLNARRTAAANVRAANGQLIPTVSTGFGAGYREGRQQFFAGQGFGSTNDQLSTDANASVSLSLTPGFLQDLAAVKASRDATEADITVAEQNLRNTVTTQYLTALQAQARASLQDTLLATTTAQLQLARARLQVGSGTQLDVQRAEVADGQQRVASLNAKNQAQIEIVRLFQQIGIAPVLDIKLDANLPATPTVDLSQVLDQAKKSNPQLAALSAREQAASKSLSSAKRAYLPSMSLSASLSAFANRYTNTNQLITSGQASLAAQKASCIRGEEVRAALNLANNLAACNAIAWTAANEQSIKDSQAKYPFGMTRNPYSLNASFSLPIFNGFRREQQIEAASVQRKNVQNDLRTQELRVTADVTAAYLSLNTAQQTVVLQEQNVRTARTALQLAQERYRVGAISIVDLVQARGDYERAETDRITAVYDVQRAFAALENAVGRPLR